MEKETRLARGGNQESAQAADVVCRNRRSRGGVLGICENAGLSVPEQVSIVGVEDLVREAAMSRHALHQAFIKLIGRPPGHELQRVRLERAKRLLVDSDTKLETVAEQSGYQSANSFWFAFKQATEMSPKEYREKFSRRV